MTIKFIDWDAVEVTREDGSVLTCFRTNMDMTWHAVWVRTKAEDSDLTPEIVAAIADYEKRNSLHG